MYFCGFFIILIDEFKSICYDFIITFIRSVSFEQNSKKRRCG